MAYSIAEYETTIAKLRDGNARLSDLARSVPGVAQAALEWWPIPDSWKASLLRLAQQLADIGAKVIEKVGGFLKGALLPFKFIELARDWGQIRAMVTGMVGDLQPSNLSVDYYWRGAASEAYKAVIPTQSAAAARLGAIADRTQVAFTWTTAGAAAFYLGLLIVVIQLIVGFIAAIAAMSTGVFSWAGVGLAIEESGIGLAEIGALVALLVAAVTTAEIQLSNLYSESDDQSAFPQGHWPSGATDRYTDATVKDDDAEWSLDPH